MAKLCQKYSFSASFLTNIMKRKILIKSFFNQFFTITFTCFKSAHIGIQIHDSRGNFNKQRDFFMSFLLWLYGIPFGLEGEHSFRNHRAALLFQMNINLNTLTLLEDTKNFTVSRHVDFFSPT